jgi:hypothetical protein
MKESNHRDRAEMQLVADEHVKAVLEFMQASVPTEKLIGLADSLPQMARLLWSHFPQEPCQAIRLFLPKPYPSQSTASESSLETDRGCGDSVEVGIGR